MTRKGMIFLIGLIPLGLVYYPVKDQLGNNRLFVAGALAYFFLLRLAAEELG